MKEVYTVDVKFYQEAIKNIKVNGDKKYISLHFSFDELSFNPVEVLQYFDANKGQRYWYRSKKDSYTYNKVGIKYIASIKKERFDDDVLKQEQSALFESIQHVDFGRETKTNLSLFGGMKFAVGETTDEWNDFSLVAFHLSKYQFDFINKVFIVTDLIKNIDFDTVIEEVVEILHNVQSANHISPVIPEISKSKDLFVKGWKQLVEKTIGKLNDDFVKVVLSRQRLLMFKENIDANYLINSADKDSANFTIYFENHGNVFISKTPERLFKIEDGTLLTSAIAGSVSRESSNEKDQANQDYLLSDHKNRFEHDLVTQDIVRNLKQYSSDVRFSKQPHILKSNFIYHLETNIEAPLDEGYNLFSILDTFHPTPAIGGFPKEQALKYIRKKEFGARGLYASPLGLIHEGDAAEFAVAIRSMFIKDRSATLYAGVGIVKDSNVEAEFEETDVKFKPMMELLGVNDESQSSLD